MGTPTSKILAEMQKSGTVYNLTTQQMRDLRAVGTPASIISQMQRPTGTPCTRTPGWPAPAVLDAGRRLLVRRPAFGVAARMGPRRSGGAQVSRLGEAVGLEAIEEVAPQLAGGLPVLRLETVRRVAGKSSGFQLHSRHDCRVSPHQSVRRIRHQRLAAETHSPRHRSSRDCPCCTRRRGFPVQAGVYLNLPSQRLTPDFHPVNVKANETPIIGASHMNPTITSRRASIN